MKDSLPSQKDTLYAQAHEAVGAFQFDESVVAVFPDMIQRSVPGYQTILTGIGELTETYAQPNSQLYDLGCSLGAATLTMRRKLTQPNCKIIAVDNSEAMVQRAGEYLHAYHSDVAVELLCADINAVAIENASVVVINFTLQFIDPDAREALLSKIFQGLKPGGILVLSEKIHFEDATLQAAIEHLHLQFKRANGYSELEISQKRSSLENVLISDTADFHINRLKNIGFESAEIWFQAYNFASFIAIKAK
ncbi:MAG: carboxy-S-adenosyl-L-methionine synthase CmoA [Thiomicrorhabdus chilensis]|uniref:carboxy-S-adenosyl-L-methionine synthase CmoA n=1 Tax=Thiomicrorhabdus chilensis TaxID=63656 RepID=UPI00299E28A2|nr:carboxy-S-adenosyl-L-methionine synthase CmoA [Thiomicrorhabdus chilensis]MDX1348083.1 carboxy-S-adenosyl-L-methionine synthase CmoA [Thiomicrorhabdus chilensis]